jgi:tetratricopeptide (TPR) repeat protein
LHSICRELECAYSFLGRNQVSSFDYRGIQYLTFASRVLGELPPPPPRACFGRGELIEEIVGLAEKLTPIALIGPGGIGKTSIALAVLHDNRIEQRFGGNRRFIACDKFTGSLTNFLARLSKAIGASVENPEDLTPLRPFLSSKKMLIVLDNAESILDPQGTDAAEISAAVEELSQFSNICLCITSRIAILPSDCETLDIPTLSIEAARDTFHHIHKNVGRPDLVSNILEQLDFHPLSITLLATVARCNKWNVSQLIREWDTRRTALLHIQQNKSLATTIELSLGSPTFQELGPDARDLLGVVAFFPQGINEDGLRWFFPTISNGKDMFEKFCVLSLTHRSGGFTTMLAPLRDYLRPKDPASSPLLHTAKECYLGLLSVFVDPGSPYYEKARWIALEDVNVEHLLDVFTSINPDSDDIWNACANFMEHLYWHKRRLVVLGPKLERLPDDHPSKPECLLQLSRLFESVVNGVERKRLLVYALKLWRERGDDRQVAKALSLLAKTRSQQLLQYKEGMLEANEALEIFERLNDVPRQALCLQDIARLLRSDQQLDAAEQAASRSIDLLQGSYPIAVCQGHRTLGDVYGSKGETEKAINHYETALGIADFFNWHTEQFQIHISLAELFRDQGGFDEAYAHAELAKSHTGNNLRNPGVIMELRATIQYKQGRFEEAKSEALCATGVFEKLGAAEDVQRCIYHFQLIENAMNKSVTSGESNFDGDLPKQRYFLHMLTLHRQLEEPATNTDGCLDFSCHILPRTANSTPGRIDPGRYLVPHRFYSLIIPSFPRTLSPIPVTSCTRTPFCICRPTIYPLIRLQCCTSLLPVAFLSLMCISKNTYSV